jgi:hypothetical protein
MSYDPGGKNEGPGAIGDYLEGKLLELGVLYKKRARSNDPKSFLKLIKKLEEEIAITERLKEIENLIADESMAHSYQYEYSSHPPLFRPSQSLITEQGRLERELKALKEKQKAEKNALEKELEEIRKQNQQTNYEIRGGGRKHRKTRRRKRM